MVVDFQGIYIPAIKNDKQPRIVKLSLLELSFSHLGDEFKKKTWASLPEPVFLDLSCFLFRKKKSLCWLEADMLPRMSTCPSSLHFKKRRSRKSMTGFLCFLRARSGGIMTSRFSVRPEELEKTFSTLQSADARMGKKTPPWKRFMDREFYLNFLDLPNFKLEKNWYV